MDTFTLFEKGKFAKPEGETSFSAIPWVKHPAFEGVELKALITAKETEGAFSYHLVRIAPGCKIGEHIHETQLETHEVIAGNGKCRNGEGWLLYEPGTISVMPAGVKHEVTAGEEGLYLFAKFMPALS